MKTQLKLLAAAALATGMMTAPLSAQNTASGSENQVNSAADRAADQTNRAADKTGAALDNAADNTRDTAREAGDRTAGTLDKAAAGQGVHGTAQAPDAEGIRDVLASTTEAALKGSFSDVVERFVDADRNRLGKAMPSDDQLKSLDALTKQLRDDWKAKYNQEFDIDKEELVFNPSVRIMQGEFAGDQARTAGERTTQVKTEVKTTGDADKAPGTADDRSGLEKAADKTGEVIKDTADKTGEVAKDAVDRVRGTSSDVDANKERGRNMATAVIPASHGLPQVTVPLIHELPDSWRIDIPDNLDAATVRANLEKHLKMAHDQKAQWPADANEAYLAVAHHVLLGIFEGSPNVQQGSDAQPAGATITPSATPATPATPGAAQ
jgi:hypothetical protein